MVEHLRLRWRDDLSMEALLGLCDELDECSAHSLDAAHLQSVLQVSCVSTRRGPIPTVSVRATILALARFGVAAREPARAPEKAWSAYRRTAGLDSYRHAATSDPARLPRCAHADER